MPEPLLGPSHAGSVVLDLGASTGALILDTPPELNDREIEISPVSAGPTGGGPQARTHSQVRERRTGAGVSYAAVYPGLPAGDYTIWSDAVTPAARVTITGGEVARCAWPDQAGRQEDTA
jgi:hypothetical protein